MPSLLPLARAPPTTRFEDEFDAQGGVEAAYSKYFDATAAKYFATHKPSEYTKAYMDYVWDANGPVPCDCMPSVDEPTVGASGCHVKP